MGNVSAGGADMLEVLLSGGTQAVLCAQHQVGKSDHRGEGVVDVMRDAAGHLAQRLEPLLLHDRLLGLAQLLVGLAQVLRALVHALFQLVIGLLQGGIALLDLLETKDSR